MGGWITENWLSLLFLGVYAAFVIRNGVIGTRQTKSTQDFYVGGRRLGGIALGFSYFATFASTNSYVGTAGQAYIAGPQWLLFTLVALLLTYISWRWIAPRLREQTEALGSLTIPDFIGLRYDSRLMRVFAAFVVVGASLFYMTAVFRGIGLTVDALWHTGYEPAIALVLVLVVIYTAAGGYISVVRTDILQGAIMLVAATLLFASALDAAGGPAVLGELLRDTPPAFAAAEPAFGVVLGIIIAATIKIVIEPRLLSRFYGLRDARAARVGMITAIAGLAIALGLLMPIGLLGRALFPEGDLDPDLIVPTLIASAQWVDPVIAAFLFVALFAAAMSSIDSVLLVTATTFHRDVLRVGATNDDLGRTVRETRWLTVGFGLLTALIALDPPGGIIPLTVFSGSLYAACLLAPVMFGLNQRRASRPAALAAMLVGAALLGTAFTTPIEDHVHPIFVATAGSVLAYLAVQMMSRGQRLPEIS